MKRAIYYLKKLIPILSAAFALLLQVVLHNSEKQKEAERPYFTYFLILAVVIFLMLFVLSFRFKKLERKLVDAGPFYAGVLLFFNILNVITAKLTLLPALFFPNIDRVLEVYVTDGALLVKCVLFSLKLLIIGFAWGGSIGLTTGLLLGFNKKVAYWLNPVTKVLGPMPTTAWTPLALSVFPATYDASVFLIAFAVWFPTALMTSSGIWATNNSYYEVSRTLGASTLYQVFKVGIPNAMPSIFMGVFYGTCSSFITLMVAELMGSSCGIGWYVNHAKQMMVYSGVYAGLMIIAVMCTTILTLLFKMRDKLLIWQKGVIKW
ncbi:MAG: transporter, permease protein [Oscillospiraceae bacterium]|nr:transporter, permease protein [Oscillospiraceae bacterium]